MLSRRTMLIVTGGAGASGLMGGNASGAVKKVTATGEAPLTSQEFRLIAAMSEGIIPKTDTPGAIGAGVPEFFRTIFNDWFLKDEQIAFRASLTAYDDEAKQRFAKPFLRCSAAEQNELLNDWDKKGAAMFARPVHPFGQFKKLTIHGYYTSQIGLELELKATMDAAQDDPNGPLIQPVSLF